MSIQPGGMPSPLEATVQGADELVITRFLKAPPSLVWDAHTKPELLKRWLLGPPGWSMPVCEVDLRVGGKYRYEWQHEAGQRMGMGGTHLEIEAPSKLINTQLFDEDWTGGEVLGRLDLLPENGGTRLINTLRYASTAARDNVLNTGMASGMEMGYQKLEALLSELQG